MGDKVIERVARLCDLRPMYNMDFTGCICRVGRAERVSFYEAETTRESVPG